METSEQKNITKNRGLSARWVCFNRFLFLFFSSLDSYILPFIARIFHSFAVAFFLADYFSLTALSCTQRLFFSLCVFMFEWFECSGAHKFIYLKKFSMEMRNNEITRRKTQFIARCLNYTLPDNECHDAFYVYK